MCEVTMLACHRLKQEKSIRIAIWIAQGDPASRMTPRLA
jgi:hypothetical protein